LRLTIQFSHTKTFDSSNEQPRWKNTANSLSKLFARSFDNARAHQGWMAVFIRNQQNDRNRVAYGRRFSDQLRTKIFRPQYPVFCGALNAIGYAMHSRRSHDAVIHVHDDAGNVIEAHEDEGDFKESWHQIPQLIEPSRIT